jgi:uncharacterized RDD family membrane protein YckC
LPGRRKKERERSWKDEVRERMDRRRQRDSGPGTGSPLPLFPDPAEPAPIDDPEPASPPSAEMSMLGEDISLPVASVMQLGDARETEFTRGARRDEGFEPLADMALHTLDERPSEAASKRVPEGARLIEEPVEDEWPLEEDEQPNEAASRPVERPAWPSERLQAALLDLGVLATLAAVVLYFAGRAAKVPLGNLQPAWPYLAGYLTLLALLYAMYFTGTTGQTLGKMLFDLRVVDTNGQAPGYVRALGRGILGTLGTLVLGLGLVPMLFDPARRGFHDRLFRTRVVRPVRRR